ncbi:hypothetical protein PRK78_005706 [Emydomyces testavorans]|uniref:C3H1-type domain-containing protein n=1 Tax=Emydomyces testavorans TaxID=2070801 RepID=A0AAF0IKZ7_9EURO|nr:hypothetical protein PRK78_005706 [Emydomyces testavorans]
MDAATDTNPSSSNEPPATSFANEYWNGMTSIYSSVQSHDQPFGIGWDHPVFQQHGSPPHPQPQTQTPDLYEHHQRGWHQTSLQNSVVAEPHQSFEIPNQFRMTYHQQPQQQQQQQSPPSYDTPQPNAAYPTYSFETPTYYQNSLSTHGSYNQQNPVDLQRVALRNVPETSLEHNPAAYAVSPSLQQNIQARPVPFANEYQTHPAAPSYHNTIDPHFLTAARHSMLQPEQTQGNVLVVNPADLERSNTPRNFQAANGEFIKRPLLPAQSTTFVQPKLTKNGIPTISRIEKPIQPRRKKETSVKAKPAARKDPVKPIKQLEESQSDSDSSDEEEEEPPEPSPLPVSRPTDLDGGIKYDALKIVWFPRNRQPSAAAIRNALVSFSDLVKGVRDVWKSRSEALKAAENQNKEDKIPAIKREVIMQRRFLDMIINTTLNNGHPSYIRRFGEHPMIVSALYSFLLDRHTAADSDGPLTVNILKLMIKFKTMDQAMLEKTKNDKILVRFVKKGGETIKKLAQIILDNAASATKHRAESSKPSSKESTPQVNIKKETLEVSYPHVLIRGPAQASARKRLREPEESNIPPPKRVVSPSSANTTSKPAPTATATTHRHVTAGSDSKSALQSANQAAKPKANIITPKPTPSLFSSLMSASKKPGTSNAARAAAAAAAKEKAKTEQEAPRPAPRPMFSFAETLADLSKPKEVVSTKPAEEMPPETEEEKAKRLRKEERRRLRVSWKPDDSLVEIRLFTHDPEEEIGRDDSARRDVSDLAGEGRTLKMHRDLDDLDDDDDDDLVTYYCPSEIDFTVLGSGERAGNFIKTGGENAPKSRAKEDQEQREVNTLSVFYTSSDDIPFSPKEPPALEKEEESYEPEEDFGQPGDQVKARSAKYFSAMAAIAAKVPAAAPPPLPATPAPPPPAAPQAQPAAQVDISTLLKVLQQNQMTSIQPRQQQPQPLSNLPDLEKIFNQFRDPNQTPSVQQTSQLPQAAPASAAQGLDWQKLLNVMTLQKHMQQAPSFPQVQATQGPDLAAVLAQLSNPGTQQGQPQQMNEPFGFGQQSSAPYENPERKRYRESGGWQDGDDGDYGGNKRPRANGDSGKPKKHPKAGLVPCRYWKEGKCLKGAECTFRHDPLD